jgi:hypothetical protein
MKRTTTISLVATALMAFSASIASATLTTLYSTDFNSGSGYSDGNLVGQGTPAWQQTGTIATTPIQVANTATNGNVVLGTSGQDAFNTLSSSITQASGGRVFLYADVNVTLAQATGDYFLHVGDGTTSNFFDKIFAKAGTAGNYQLGATVNASTGTYAAANIALGTTTHVVAEYDIIPGATNDQVQLYINPVTDPALGGVTPDLTAANTGIDMSTFASVNLRQGTASNAPGVNVDNVKVVYSDAPVVPEPSAIVLASLGLLGFTGLARRKSA